MSEYVPQAWRFGNGPNQYYAESHAEHYARTMAAGIGIDYSDADYDKALAEFLADLAAHDAEVAEKIAQSIEGIATRGPGNGSRHPQTIKVIAARIAREAVTR